MLIIFHQLIMQREVFNCTTCVCYDLSTWFLYIGPNRLYRPDCHQNI